LELINISCFRGLKIFSFRTTLGTPFFSVHKPPLALACNIVHTMCSPADDSGWWLRPANVRCLLPEIILWPGSLGWVYGENGPADTFTWPPTAFRLQIATVAAPWKPPTSSTKCPRTALEKYAEMPEMGGLHDFFRIRYLSSWPESLAPLPILFTRSTW